MNTHYKVKIHTATDYQRKHWVKTLNNALDRIQKDMIKANTFNSLTFEYEHDYQKDRRDGNGQQSTPTTPKEHGGK